MYVNMTHAFHVYIYEYVPMYVHMHVYIYIYIYMCVFYGGALGVMVIVEGNGHGNNEMRLIAFHIALIPLGKV